MSQQLSRVRPSDLDDAAMNVVTCALRVARGESFVVIADNLSYELADALSLAGQRVSASVSVANLDEYEGSARKLLPSAVASALEHAQASVFVAEAHPQELGLRQHLLHLVAKHELRHAHMPGISRLAFMRGLRADPREVLAAGRRVLGRATHARRIEVLSAIGTRLSIELIPGTRWFAQLGVLEPGRWGNLPAGALYATPELIEGTFVANASLGEYFGAREGVLTRTPVTFHIAANRVEHVEAPHSRALEREIEAMLSVSPNSNRIGMICLGVNAGVTSATGEGIVDQNLPGLHLAIGDPAARITGATWSAPTSFGACAEGSSVVIDGSIAVHQGKLPTLT